MRRLEQSVEKARRCPVSKPERQTGIRDKAEVATPALAAIVAADREDIQKWNLKALAAVTSAGAGVNWLLLASFCPLEEKLLWLSIFTTTGAAICYALAEVRPGMAKLLFFSLCLVMTTVCLLLAPGRADIVLIMPALVAGALLRPWAAPAVGCASAAAILLAQGGQALLLAGAVSLLSTCIWLVLRPLYDLLGRYSKQSLQAVALAEELREQRGKLNRTIKDLSLSYELLRKTNRELALACQEADMLRELRHRFATNLSHELRTPLNIILGFSRLIYTRPELYGYASWNDELRRDLAEIQRNAGYLTELLDDIIDLARIDALSMPIRREPTDIVKVAQEALRMVQALARDKGLDLLVLAPPELPQVPIDPVRIKQVLYNLLTNAVRHTESGRIVVRIARDGQEVLVSVEDTGSGIGPEELSRIFDEFHQLARPKDGAEAGKGLGLSIAKRFVQLHGGRIWAESELGRGSTFTFSIPLSEKRVSPASRPSGVPSLPAKHKPLVLVVSEDELAAAYLRRRLPDYEFVTVSAPPGAQGDGPAEQPLAVLYNAAAPGMQWQAARCPAEGPVCVECPLPSASWLDPSHLFAGILFKPITEVQLESCLSQVLGGRECRRVLVVDDDRGFARLVQRMFQSMMGDACAVQLSYSGEEALQFLQEYRPDLVLLDLLLPNLSGFEVAERMRALPSMRGVPLVAVTALTPGEDRLARSEMALRVSWKGAQQPFALVRILERVLEVAAGKASPERGAFADGRQ
jgi:signal transduction histidine kinase/CheY-like chemotaxis protein